MRARAAHGQRIDLVDKVREMAARSNSPGMKKSKPDVAALMTEAAAISHQRKLRLTPIRKNLLQLMARLNRAVGAYELLAELQKSDPEFRIVMVYRTLDFLRKHGFIHRIESLNAFIVCWHPEDNHQAQLLICDSCKEVREVEVPGIAELLGKKARAAGFTGIQQTVEAHGICSACSGA